MKTEFKIDGYRTLITGDRLQGILRCASMVPNGAWAECGVYKGGSLRCMADNFPDQEIIGFDTFTGLPKEQWKKTEKHKPSEFDDTDLTSVKEYLIDNKNVSLVAGLFPESACLFKDYSFSFVHVDFDFELGILAAIDFFWPKMVSGGIMIFDDFAWENTPGVKKALQGYKVIPTANYQVAIIK